MGPNNKIGQSQDIVTTCESREVYLNNTPSFDDLSIDLPPLCQQSRSEKRLNDFILKPKSSSLCFLKAKKQQKAFPKTPNPSAVWAHGQHCLPTDLYFALFSVAPPSCRYRMPIKLPFIRNSKIQVIGEGLPNAVPAGAIGKIIEAVVQAQLQFVA